MKKYEKGQKKNEETLNSLTWGYAFWLYLAPVFSFRNKFLEINCIIAKLEFRDHHDLQFFWKHDTKTALQDESVNEPHIGMYRAGEIVVYKQTTSNSSNKLLFNEKCHTL